MKQIAIALSLVAVMLLAGCASVGIHGNGTIASENRSIPDFTRMAAEGGFDIRWSTGQPALSVTADQNLLPHIRTEVTAGKLRIYSDTQLAPTKDVALIVSSSGLDDVDLVGAIHFTATGITGGELNISTTGAVNVDASGTVTRLTARMTGASQLQASDLIARTAVITATGAATANVNVTESLNASISGAGSLTYSGNPPHLDQHVTGAGSIHHRP
jgi:hypothetical protein